MRNRYYALLVLFCSICLFYACKDSSPEETDKDCTVIKPEHKKIAANLAYKKKSAEIPENEGCLSYIPQRVINATVIPGVEFTQVDFTGYEKLDLPTGDRLLVINWGCQTYNLTFRFETSRFGTDTSKIKQWYSILTQLLYVIEPAVESPVKIQQGIDQIHSYLKQDTVPLAYNTHLNIRNDSILSDMVFEQIKLLGDTAVRLDATFSISSL
jgi:hypothetical protein